MDPQLHSCQKFVLIGDPTVRKRISFVSSGVGKIWTSGCTTFILPLLGVHQTEFRRAEVYLEDYGGAMPPFSVVLQDLVDLIIENTVQGRYVNLFLYADSVSRFLDALVNSRNLLDAACKERAQMSQRRSYKVCQYICGITYLIQEAIPHRCVTDTLTGIGEGEFDLCENVHDAVSRGLEQPWLSQEIVDKPNFPSIQLGMRSRGTAHHPSPQPTIPHPELEWAKRS